MNEIKNFKIRGLHGFRNINLRFKDNTLILVGENGAGKTTVLHLLYYLLSGQWSAIARYQFDYLELTIGERKHVLTYKDFEGSLSNIDKKLLNRLPPPTRRRVISLLEQTEGRLPIPELEMLCDQYDIPIHYFLRQVDLFEPQDKTNKLMETMEAIRGALGAQLLYLPTTDELNKN